MGIEERIDGSKSWSERAAERVPGCRGYKDRELRHETDKRERRCLAERLDGARGALQEVQRDLSRQGGLDLLGVIDNAACKLGVIRDRVEFADYGCAGFFDITEVGEQSRKTASHPQCGDDPRPCDHNRQGWFVPQLWRRARTSRQRTGTLSLLRHRDLPVTGCRIAHGLRARDLSRRAQGRSR